VSENLEMLKLSHQLAKIQREMQIDGRLEELVLSDYEHSTIEQLENKGLSLIAKHARSLYSLV